MPSYTMDGYAQYQVYDDKLYLYNYVQSSQQDAQEYSSGYRLVSSLVMRRLPSVNLKGII
jgi:hypothetical protein